MVHDRNVLKRNTAALRLKCVSSLFIFLIPIASQLSCNFNSVEKTTNRNLSTENWRKLSTRILHF